jgi:predicted nucleic acid-binding protein
VELADTSAWTNRYRDAAVRKDFDGRVLAGDVATSPPVLLEMLWSARDAHEFSRIESNLTALPQLEVPRAAWERAVAVWRELLQRGRHRQVSRTDLLVAAVAELAGVGVCHYDRHFEVIAEVTGQPVRAIAPLGTL